MLRLPRRPSQPTTSPYEKLGLRDLPFATEPVIDPNSNDPRRNGDIFATSSVQAEIEKFERLLIRPADFGNRVKLASLWAKGQAYQGRGMGKTALLRYFQRRINPDWGYEEFGGRFSAVVVYVAFPDQVDRRWMEQLAWAALVEVCENGVLDASRASLRRDAMTDDEVDSIINVSGDTHLENLLDDAILEGIGIKPDIIDSKIETLLLSAGVTRDAARALAKGDFKEFLEGLRRDGNLRPYYIPRETKGLDYACNLFFNDIVYYLRAAGFAGGYLFIDDIENLADKMARWHQLEFAKELGICTVRPGYANSAYGFFSCVLTTHDSVIRWLSAAWDEAGLSSFARLDPDAPTSVELPLPTPNQATAIITAHLDYYRLDHDEDGSIKPLTEDGLSALIRKGQLPRELLSHAALTFMLAAEKGVSSIDAQLVSDATDSQSVQTSTDYSAGLADFT